MNSELRETGLQYVSDQLPGISRMRSGDAFRYIDPNGNRVTTPHEISRIEGLGIPPAYEKVWICPFENGHLQATGLDERGRKQYRYHPRWQEVRSQTKFNNLICFGNALPRIRRQVRVDLKSEPGEKLFTLASIVTLLDQVPLRVGNPEYTKQNETYGATTLLNRHVEIEDGIIRLKYRAKGGKRVQRSLRNKRLHKILERTADLPGAEFFTYRTSQGDHTTISSTQLNDYLVEASGKDTVTAKTFRTWAGTRTAFECAAKSFEQSEPLTIKAMAETASKHLFNTPTIARNSYIHPSVIRLAGNNHIEAIRAMKHATSTDISMTDLRKSEAQLLTYLQRMNK